MSVTTPPRRAVVRASTVLATLTVLAIVIVALVRPVDERGELVVRELRELTPAVQAPASLLPGLRGSAPEGLRLVELATPTPDELDTAQFQDVRLWRLDAADGAAVATIQTTLLAELDDTDRARLTSALVGTNPTVRRIGGAEVTVDERPDQVRALWYLDERRAAFVTVVASRADDLLTDLVALVPR